MVHKTKRPFDPKLFLSKIDGGQLVSDFRSDQVIYSQGDPSDSVFYIHAGKVKLVVLSKQGKEAVVAILGAGAFLR